MKLAGRFMEHEKALLTEVTRLRGRGPAGPPARRPSEIGKRFEVEGQLGQRASAKLLVSMVEAYPELKVRSAGHGGPTGRGPAEAQITAARRFYNAAVNQLNNSIQIFPGQIIASIAGVQAMPFFEAPEAARVAPSVDSLLGRSS